MGKSATAKMFAEEGVPVHDADATVHRLYDGEAVAAIEAAFPGTTAGGKVDRIKLGRRVLADKAAIKRLEQIVHPMVRKAEEAFLAAAERDGATIAVLDIPLLFETGGEKRCDAVVVVSAPAGRAARPRLRAPRHERGQICGDPRPADAGRGKARPRRFRGGYLARIRRGTRAGA